MSPTEREEELTQLRRMQHISILEGTTLLLLLGVAVPLKHLAGIPLAVRIMGPIHGLAFVLYLWSLIQMLSGGRWSRADTLRLIAAAFIPFGAFANDRILSRHARSLTTAV